MAAAKAAENHEMSEAWPDTYIEVKFDHWKILWRVPNKVKQRKIHEAYYVMCLCPTLNNQLELTSLTLLRNGVT